ncbi:GH25 family lysozyme [Nocardia sp. NPDC059246]|uniref:GH25 family lysozyme n=1 Tax=unclassified Nocardia TaxID=2637762 RepID=UPI0036C64225
MTIFGIDVSNNNGPGLDMNQVAAEGFSFVFCKVSEGDYFVDHTWPAYRAAAQAAGLLTVGYHYAIAACDPAAQAATFVAAGGGPRVMLDFEANSGDIADYWALVRAFNTAGVIVVLSYLPRWYWQQIGCPDLTQVPGLIASNYVPVYGYASAIYPGDDSPRWAAYGGVQPSILQFTDRALVAGAWVDANAFRGTSTELAALLTGQPQGGFLMALNDQQQEDLYQKVTDIWEQLRGPNGQGWPQLGQNAQGQNLSMVDGIGTLKAEVEVIEKDLEAGKAS